MLCWFLDKSYMHFIEKKNHTSFWTNKLVFMANINSALFFWMNKILQNPNRSCHSHSALFHRSKVCLLSLIRFYLGLCLSHWEILLSLSNIDCIISLSTLRRHKLGRLFRLESRSDLLDIAAFVQDQLNR